MADQIRAVADDLESSASKVVGRWLVRVDRVSHTMNDGSISTNLYQFFAAYFHQDWDLEADDWQGIVDNYVSADPVAEPLRRTAQEIDDMCAARSEVDLSQFLLRKVGVCYDPRPELTYKEWLGQVAARLRQHAAAIDGGATSPTS